MNLANEPVLVTVRPQGFLITVTQFFITFSEERSEGISVNSQKFDKCNRLNVFRAIVVLRSYDVSLLHQFACMKIPRQKLLGFYPLE